MTGKIGGVRRDLRRRKFLLYELREEHDEVADTFAVGVCYATEGGEVDIVGGWVGNWSKLTPEQQEAVKGKLRQRAEREAKSGRRL